MVNELVELLIGGYGIEREDFRKRFQRLLNRVPQRGSTTKPEFSTYSFLGSVLTLPYTKLKDEIGVKASSVKITSKETVKLVFKIEKDGKTKLVFKTITTVERIGNKQYLDINEFKEALGSLDLTGDELNNCEVEGEIVHIKDGVVKLETLKVIEKGELNSEILRNLGPLPKYNEEEARFKKVKDSVIEKGNLNNALEQFSKKSLEVGPGELSPSSKGAEAFFENLAQVYKAEMVLESDNEDVADRKLRLSNYEAPMHGFVCGALAMNFRYEHALRIRPEQAAGKGFVDLVVGSNGREFRVELKGHENTAQKAKDQSEKEGYNKAPIIFSFGEKEKAKSVTMVFANLCLDPSSSDGLLVEESKVSSKPEGLIELFKKHDGENLKKELKKKLNYLYYSISDSNGGGENTNYLSRLILGELLSDGSGLEKHVFIYGSEEDHVEHTETVLKGRTVPGERLVTSANTRGVALVFKSTDDKSFVVNVIEDAKFSREKSIPLDRIGIDHSKCKQVNVIVNPEANGGFEVKGDLGKSYYQGIEIGGVTNFENKYKGEFKTIEYVTLQDITDITQVRGFQEALFPLRKLITLENHFQAILQGLLSAQKGVEVWAEPNYSSKGRPDLLISHRVGDSKIRVAAVELKLAPKERGIDEKVEEGKAQLKERADGLEVITKEEKVEAVVLVVCSSAEDKDKFITHFRGEDLSVGHSSRGSSPQRAPYSPMQGEVSSLDKTVEWQHEISIHQGPDGSISVQPGPSGSQSNSDRSPQHSVLSPIDQNSPSKRLSAEGLRRAATCLPSPPKKPRLSKRAAIGDGCLLDMDEDKKVNKENTGIEINEENFDESKIDNEKLRAYQEGIKDEGSEINDQLNKLIIEIQQARAFKHFSDIGKAVKEKLFPALLDVDGISSESANYFEQMCKLNLLRIISPIIKDEDFKSLLFNNPEKLVKDQSLLENVFASVENLISDKYKQQQLQYEDFENLENQINEEILNKNGETEVIANQDVSKTDLSNYVFESVGLSLLMGQDIEVSTDLQKRIYYETLINLGALIHDHKNHIQITHNGGHHTPRMNSLVESVKSSKLLSVAYDLYYLRKNKGDVNQSDLYSSKIKNTISIYGSINSEYKLNDIHNKFDIGEFKSYFSEDELKKFGAEFKAYDKEVITIHSTQVFTSSNEVHVKVRDNNGEVKQLIIGSVEGIKNIANYSYNKETLEIKLKLGNGKEYTITHEEEKIDGEVKYYINIEGYKTKVGDIIKSFTNQEKDNIRQKLGKLQDKIELLEIKRDIEVMADIEVSDENYIREVRQNLLAQGVSESTFNQLERHLDYVNEEVFNKYVNGVSKKLTEKNIEFSNSKFDLAKVKGAKGNKFFSIMAIYDLFDSTNDVPTLGRYDNDALKKIFGINSILDAMDDVRESISARYIRPDGTVVTKIRPDSGMGKVVSKIPQSMRKAFVRIISNPAVQAITFATIGYQFGHGVDAIVKGDHHPLNYYFATSNGIKLLSMSMKPISMGVSAAVKGLGVTTKALRVVSISKVLGKLSVATGVIDSAVTIGINTYEGVEYVKATASEILLSNGEQLELFIERILNTMPWYQWIIGGRPRSDYYENAIKIKGFLDWILAEGKGILSYSSVATTVQCLTSVKAGDYNLNAALRYLLKRDNDSLNAYLTSIKNHCSAASVSQCLASKRDNDGLSAVVQYVTSIKDEYSEIIESDRSPRAYNPECTTKSKYTGSSLGEISSNVGNLSSLDISKVLPLVSSTLGGREVYFVNKDIKYLPHVTLDEYNDGLRVVMMPSSFREGSLTCDDVINEKVKSHSWPSKCNDGKVYRNCTKTFTLSGEPFVFANGQASSSFPILYLSVPGWFIAAQNRPAIVYLPKDGLSCRGSENHDNVFIINYNTSSYIWGGTANNTIVMNYNTSDISVRLHTGTIDIADSRIRLVTNIFRNYIYNYISHSTANQNITTGCKTRYVDSGKGGGNNSIQNYDVNCQDKDYEVRKVNKNDEHLRSTKRTIFIVDKSSGSGANISSDNLKLKENLDVISVENADVAQLRINEHQNDYRLDFIACSKVISVNVDSFEKLVIQLKKVGITEIITIQDKSLLDIIEDMAYQKLGHAGADIDDKIIENSRKRSKAVITADITGLKNTTAYAVARDIAESSNNLGATVSQIGVIKGDTIVNYAVNNLNQIKLITNNGTIISAEKQLEYDRFLFHFIESGDVYLVNHFLDKGANLEAKKGNMTPLMSTVLSRRNGEIMIDLLLDRGANIDAKSTHNWTAAGCAVLYKREDLVIKLVNKGADIGYRDNTNPTLLDIAKRLGLRRIEDFLRGKQSEEPLKRKRRHHHRDHDRHHSSRKPLAIDLSNQPEVAASNANQKYSWINIFANTVVGAVKGVSQFIFSPFKPAIDMGHSQPSKAITAQSIDTNSTLLLLDVFIRKITGQKYVSTADQPISLLEAQGYALNIIGRFEEVVKQTALKSSISMHRLDIDFVKVQEEVTRKITGGKFSEIAEILNSYVEKACPSKETGCPGKLSLKKFDKFMAEFNNGLNAALNQPMQQILSRDSTLKASNVKEQQISLEPRSYLNDTSVQVHLTQTKGLRNQGKALIP
ncbi:latrotoxin-related protein [Wolbachia endosymbiont of Oedothorax gibbosus]|uniref:latrotoxin-related protein n=1 Tax=Wolbachia endosymbiont of Oedothorax gibbosus TaxID=931100 RepID=UPI0020251DD0|nr:latrotoxin-related protein [Wolbachia endosymbiont of Oedothorax gibbosus]